MNQMRGLFLYVFEVRRAADLTLTMPLRSLRPASPPSWPVRTERRQPGFSSLEIPQWKIAILEEVWELNSSPSELEILAAAVETGLYVLRPYLCLTC
jgi:hypothetical protein